LKERKGMIERVLPDGMGAVCRGLFKRETDMSVFEGATVTIGSGLAGVVEGRFGTSGKCKLRLEPPGLDPHRSGGAGQGVTLRYKRYVHDSDVSRRSGVRQ
jgi:selenocysteine-specific elongation factor